MMILALCAVCPPQEPLDQVLRDEARRVAVIARCQPAVCSVMSMDEPGGGSGVVIDPVGFVLTNYHVVGEPDDDHELPGPPDPSAEQLAEWRATRPEVTGDDPALLKESWQAWWRSEFLPRGSEQYKNKKVGLPDGQLYEGVVLGIDPGSDLALLRLLPKHEGQTWPFCTLGNSDELLVGETVFAMGNPFLLATDFTPTVTFGIVSGTHRYQEGQGNRMLVYPDCIQVDAPVNPGNSGGPLFNEAGEVVGINGRISIGDRGRVNVGVGFAIASNQIANFLGDLVAGRHAEHGTLDMSAWFMRSQREARRGVFVQQLFRDSVVAKAGVGLGDEILSFNGMVVRSANQLATMVGVLPAATWVTLGYRPALPDGGFGDDRLVTLALTRLDTGSSRDGTGASARLASRHDRRLAGRSLLRRWQAAPTLPEPGRCIRWERIGPDGQPVLALACGDHLRLEVGSLTLVQHGDECFAIADGVTRDASVEERERLRRELVSMPTLWTRAQLERRLGDALLLGGISVHGAPGLRFEIPGDGECEAWLGMDGSPLGGAFRDPLRRSRIEWHVREDRLRVIVDGMLATGWSCRPAEVVTVDEAWFRRDGR